jgi:phosphoadenosine phosphosulfate reductase
VEDWSAERLLLWSFERFHRQAALVSSFGPEGLVLIHLAAGLWPDFRIITIDTDFLFPETYAQIEKIERRYHVHVEHARPRLTPEEQAHTHGPALWSRQPDLCCEIRKVQPLREKLTGLGAWITGIRREQTPTRAGIGKLEWDASFGLVKLNPLADWTKARVWQFVREHQLPYNPLHDQNYPSIGCTHCTRAVLPGEDSRAGRWSGFNKTECGLHGRE